MDKSSFAIALNTELCECVYAAGAASRDTTPRVMDGRSREYSKATLPPMLCPIRKGGGASGSRLICSCTSASRSITESVSSCPVLSLSLGCGEAP